MGFKIVVTRLGITMVIYGALALLSPGEFSEPYHVKSETMRNSCLSHSCVLKICFQRTSAVFDTQLLLAVPLRATWTAATRARAD